jgi:hypothetical protein
VSRVAAIAVIDNPFGGRIERDLSTFRYRPEAQRIWP